MPYIQVPQWRPETPTTPQIQISYNILGDGPILVLLIPGLCVPSTMYDSICAMLATTRQFTAISIDNRGMGRSSVPYATPFSAKGYTVQDLAYDAWTVADTVRANSSHQYQQKVALVGHSMGGMVVQRMIQQRPHHVAFIALLATNSGGLYHLMPTIKLIRAIGRLVLSGFDTDVNAAVNLRLHFTDRFLDDLVGWDDHLDKDEQPQKINDNQCNPKVLDQSLLREKLHAAATQEDSCDDITAETSDEDDIKPGGKNYQTQVLSSKSHVTDNTLHTEDKFVPHQNSETLSPALPTSSPNLGFVETKILEVTQDASVYFGINKSSLVNVMWKPQRLLLEAITRKKRRHEERRRRYEIYHARYTGREKHELEEMDRDIGHELPITPSNTPSSSSAHISNPDDSTNALYGHIAVVRSHRLSRACARKLRQCSKIVKLVMIGRHDCVIRPASSRALASAIDANTVVEVDAAHFITDEAAAEVTTHVLYGLRKAFFAPRAKQCKCELCQGNRKEENRSCSRTSLSRLLRVFAMGLALGLLLYTFIFASDRNANAVANVISSFSSSFEGFVKKSTGQWLLSDHSGDL